MSGWDCVEYVNTRYARDRRDGRDKRDKRDGRDKRDRSDRRDGVHMGTRVHWCTGSELHELQSFRNSVIETLNFPLSTLNSRSVIPSAAGARDLT